MTKAPAIFCALDRPDLDGALALGRALDGVVDGFKVGLEFVTANGPDGVRRVVALGAPVFLDLKFHDIPNTVRGAVRTASRTGAALVTVHASGGADMLRAAVDEAGDRCGVLAVTVLTSLNASALSEAWGRPVTTVEDEVLRLAEIARSAGAHGIVCAASEAASVRAVHGDGLRLLVPGVRLEGGATQDQVRTATPVEAVAAGATYLVLGRAVTGAADPRAVMHRVQEMIA
jgi:orotidine-5'-phosphate decarboxylase